MNINSRKQKISSLLSNETKLNKIAQEAISNSETVNQDGEAVAHNIFKQIVNDLSLDEFDQDPSI